MKEREREEAAIHMVQETHVPRGRKWELTNFILSSGSLCSRSYCFLCLLCLFLLGLDTLREIKRAIDVLNHNHRPVCGLDEQFSELWIWGDFCKLHIIDIILQEIRNCSYHAGFAGPRRSIQQVASFPCFPCSLIELLSLGEVQKVSFDLHLQLWVHG